MLCIRELEDLLAALGQLCHLFLRSPKNVTYFFTINHSIIFYTCIILPPILYRLMFYIILGGMGVTSAWSPLGNFLEDQAHPNVFAFHRTRFFYFCDVKFFCVCFPVVQGFSLRLVCLFSNSFQFKFFIYSLYIHIYIFYIFFHCTVGSLICAG